MALPDSLKLTVGTPIVLADTTDYSPAANNNLGTRTDQIDLTSLGDAVARESAQIDFGENRAPLWQLGAAFELAATPTAGEVINIYLAPSNSGTAAVGNPAGVTGTAGAPGTDYAGYSSNLASSLKQLMFLGSFVTTVQATGTIQVDTNIAEFVPPSRYGTIVVENQSGAAFHSDMVESSIVMTPVEHQVQD